VSDAQKLGPRQLAWVEALESGEYQQGKVKLHHNGKYCCLGVAEVLRTGEANPLFNRLSWEAYEYLKLHDGIGTIVGKRLHRYRHLSSANDAGVTHTEIAAFIRANPSAVFTGGA
jgi:hypothetical protein